MYELRRSRTNCDYSLKGRKWASGVGARHERSLSFGYGRKRKKKTRHIPGCKTEKEAVEAETEQEKRQPPDVPGGFSAGS